MECGGENAEMLGFDECGGILVAYYKCSGCDVEFKRVFDVVEEKVINNGG